FCKVSPLFGETHNSESQKNETQYSDCQNKTIHNRDNYQHSTSYHRNPFYKVNKILPFFFFFFPLLAFPSLFLELKFSNASLIASPNSAL
uniref:Ovule protein n=1 Tax=Romanomermis culicivorax TaxID=13658 RepID=A0A915L3E4_ROMCU